MSSREISRFFAETATTCRLLKDVDGVYDGDPGQGSRSARRYAQLSYDDALALRAKVVQEKALRFAREHGLTFEVAAPGAERSTRIGPLPTRLAEAAEPPAPAADPGSDFTQQST